MPHRLAGEPVPVFGGGFGRGITLGQELVEGIAGTGGWARRRGGRPRRSRQPSHRPGGAACQGSRAAKPSSPSRRPCEDWWYASCRPLVKVILEYNIARWKGKGGRSLSRCFGLRENSRGTSVERDWVRLGMAGCGEGARGQRVLKRGFPRRLEILKLTGIARIRGANHTG
jgi:hypothetical protein